MSDNGYRCGHAACECTVLDSGAFCSDHCEAAAEAGEGTPCRCGHEVCEHRQERAEQASRPGHAGPT